MAGPHLAPAALRRFPATRRPTSASPLVSVVIVNYRRWKETAALVEQLQSDALLRDWLEIIVVDNASPDDPRARRLQRHRGVKLLRNRANYGFSAGVNRGFRHSRGEWLLVLNPDLVLCAGFTDLLGAATRELRREEIDGKPVGIVGFQLRNRDGTHQQSVGFFPTFAKMIRGLLQRRRERKYLPLEASERQAVPWVTGCCLLVRRQCFEDLGGFDEDFFLYYEDVDLCRRAAAKGWVVCYEPAVQLVHLDPLQNRKPVPAPLWAITRHASLTYFRKHLAGWQYHGLEAVVRKEAWLRERLARLFGRQSEATICSEVRHICRDLGRGRSNAARQRLDHVLHLAGMA